MKEHTTEKSATPEGAYVAPAIERREDVKGLLGDWHNGSYTPR